MPPTPGAHISPNEGTEMAITTDIIITATGDPITMADLREFVAAATDIPDDATIVVKTGDYRGYDGYMVETLTVSNAADDSEATA